MAWVHENIEDAVSLIEKWLEEPQQRKKFIENLKEFEKCNNNAKVYTEFILETIDGCTNHVIKTKNI